LHDEAWHAAIDKGVREIFQGITGVAVSSGGEFFPKEEGMDNLIVWMKSIKASELLFEGKGGKLLAVKHDYGDSVVAIRYDGPGSPADLARLVQLMFTRHDMRACNREFVPAQYVKGVKSRWKRRIALVFGDSFASRLIEMPLKGKDDGALTPKDLEEARLAISRMLGDCLPLDKVNK
jgi:hypothetical protein